ncbi:MAG TPA: helix-turn-helix domain-containing protein [Acholeplasmataceae bacterium]|jgi:transcriptional regulator with XRE-family HTH domain|nr:helix-turn-helix domain-containing protein [Acholeplasmataceae bacterium]
MKIGARIKDLRTLCGLTQEELADRCELTKGYISQLENDLTSPSISTLTDLLDALGTDIRTFFAGYEQEEKIVFGEDDYFVKEDESSKITWLVPNSQKNIMEPICFTLKAGQETIVDLPHEGQEFGFVLEGTIQISHGNKRFACRRGETFYYTTDKPHKLINPGKTDAKIIWVTSPPNF